MGKLSDAFPYLAVAALAATGVGLAGAGNKKLASVTVQPVKVFVAVTLYTPVAKLLLVEDVAFKVIGPFDQTKLYVPPPEVIVAIICPLGPHVGCVRAIESVGSAFTVTTKLRLIGQLKRVSPLTIVRV